MYKKITQDVPHSAVEQRRPSSEAIREDVSTIKQNPRAEGPSVNSPEVLQSVESDVPTGVKVNFLLGKWDNLNFQLKVVNVRQKNGENIGGTLPSGGMVSEVVENNNEHLKKDTKHSGWHEKSSSTDSHSIPRSNICGGTKDNRWFKAGQTIASQLFLYKSSDGKESVIPNSGFHIRYTNRVYDKEGNEITDREKVDAKDVSYSIFEMEKKPMKVEVKGHSSEPGTGGTRIVKWRIEEPSPGTFAWNIKKLDE